MEGRLTFWRWSLRGGGGLAETKIPLKTDWRDSLSSDHVRVLCHRTNGSFRHLRHEDMFNYFDERSGQFSYTLTFRAQCLIDSSELEDCCQPWMCLRKDHELLRPILMVSTFYLCQSCSAATSDWHLRTEARHCQLIINTLSCVVSQFSAQLSLSCSFFPPPVFKRLYLEHVFLLTLLDWGLQRSKAAWTHTEVPEVLVRRHQSFLSGKFDALLHVPRRFEVDLSDNQTPEFCFSLFWFQKLLLFFPSISSFT